MSDPVVEITLLRERLQSLEALVLKQGQQLIVAAQNFKAVTEVLKQLIKQGNSYAEATLVMTKTVGQQQAQIAGLALIQRTNKPDPTRRIAYDPMAGTAAAASPFALGVPPPSAGPDIALP